MDLLTTLSDRCVGVLDIAAAGMMLATPRSAAGGHASREAMRVVELFELHPTKARAWTASTVAGPVVNQDLATAAARWPASPVAEEAGFGAADAIPMHLRGEIIGALNLFHTETGSMAASTSSSPRRSLTSRPSRCCRTGQPWRLPRSTSSSARRCRAAS